MVPAKSSNKELILAAGIVTIAVGITMILENCDKKNIEGMLNLRPITHSVDDFINQNYIQNQYYKIDYL